MMQEGPIDFRVRWWASPKPSCVKESELDTFRERYRILDTIAMFVPTPNEMACYPREGCVVVREAILSWGMKLPLHPFFLYLLRHYNLALPN